VVSLILYLSISISLTVTVSTGDQPPSQPLGKKAIVQVASFFLDGEGNYLTHKTGSGSVVREDGLILTNSHVIRNTAGGCGTPIPEADPIADLIVILVLDEEGLPPVPQYAAEVVGEDRDLDVATLKIKKSIGLDIPADQQRKPDLHDLVQAVKEKRYLLEAAPSLDLPKLGLGDSESIRAGDRVTTYGYPALEELPRFTVTTGNISQIQEEGFILVEHAFAARGSSGGAIIEEANQLLVGVLCGSGPEPSVYTGELLARARPLNLITAILPEDVYQHPLAEFTFSPRHPLLGQPVQFDASASRSIRATITKYEWDFDGDGSFDMGGKIVTKSFLELPSRKVTLRVTNDRGYSSIVTHMVPLWSNRLTPGKCSIMRGGESVQAFQFIQDCIDAAQEGDTILVSPGRYRESLLIGKALTLKAEGEVILEGDSQVPAITIVEAEGVTIEGFTITNGLPGVNVEDSSSVSIVDNTFQDNLGQGILFRRSSGEITGNKIKETMWDVADRWGRGIQLFDISDDLQVTIADNSISENDDAGIGLLNATAEIGNNTVISNRNRGVSIEDGSTATLVDNVIKGNTAFGVFVIKSQTEIHGGEIAETQPEIDANFGEAIQAGEDAHLVVAEVQILRNRDGVMLTDNASAEIKENTVISYNDQTGIRLGGLAQAAITESTVSENGWCGIELLNSAQANITGSTVSENGWCGIRLLNSAQANITESTVSENWCGIQLRGSAQANISGNIISGNGAGISMWDYSAQATIEENTISGNWEDGISMRRSAQATIVANTIISNKGYGVTLYQQPCNDTAEVFTGHVSGKANTIPGPQEPDSNGKGAVCPEDLKFLMTEEGGEYP
jgi:parallel beta-helix repeat protein